MRLDLRLKADTPWLELIFGIDWRQTHELLRLELPLALGTDRRRLVLWARGCELDPHFVAHWNCPPHVELILSGSVLAVNFEHEVKPVSWHHTRKFKHPALFSSHVMGLPVVKAAQQANPIGTWARRAGSPLEQELQWGAR